MLSWFLGGAPVATTGDGARETAESSPEGEQQDSAPHPLSPQPTTGGFQHIDSGDEEEEDDDNELSDDLDLEGLAKQSTNPLLEGDFREEPDADPWTEADFSVPGEVPAAPSGEGPPPTAASVSSPPQHHTQEQLADLSEPQPTAAHWLGDAMGRDAAAAATAARDSEPSTSTGTEQSRVTEHFSPQDTDTVQHAATEWVPSDLQAADDTNASLPPVSVPVAGSEHEHNGETAEGEGPLPAKDDDDDDTVDAEEPCSSPPRGLATRASDTSGPLPQTSSPPSDAPTPHGDEVSSPAGTAAANSHSSPYLRRCDCLGASSGWHKPTCELYKR